jgi:hypothetical protein
VTRTKCASQDGDPTAHCVNPSSSGSFAGEGLYTRSVNGPDAGWFRGTRATHQGRITAGGVDVDVEFVDVADRPDETLDDDIDEAYRVKYGRNSSPVAHITSATARMTTLKLQPTTTKDD